MKIMKYLAFALALLMLSVSVIGCQPAENKETATVTVTVSFVAPDKTVLAPTSVTVTYPVDAPATVFDAAAQVLEDNAIDYAPYEDREEILRVEDYADGSVIADGDKSFSYIWLYTLNGVEPEETVSAGGHVIAEGDTIVFTFSAYEEIVEDGASEEAAE